MNDLSPLVQAARDDFERADAPAELENAKARYLGKNGSITEQLKALAALSAQDKKLRTKEATETLTPANRSAINTFSPSPVKDGPGESGRIESHAGPGLHLFPSRHEETAPARAL